MCLIKLYKNEQECEVFTQDIGSFYKQNQELIQKGYRIYNDHDVCEGGDITVNVLALQRATAVTVLRPAAGPVLIGAAIIAGTIAVTAVVISSMQPDIPEYQVQAAHVDKKPTNVERKQVSSTNSLGQRENEPISGRIDDIYGRVNRHVPKLISPPRTFYVRGVEYEEYELLVGRGKLKTHGVFEGDSPFANIPDARCQVHHINNRVTLGLDVYEPEFHVSAPTGTLSVPRVRKPVGGFVAQELVAPNEVSTDLSLWQFNGIDISGSWANKLQLTYSGSDDLTASWVVGARVDMDVSFHTGSSTITVEEWTGDPINGETRTGSWGVTAYQMIRLKGNYRILTVEPNRITLDTSVRTDTEIYPHARGGSTAEAWAQVQNQTALDKTWTVIRSGSAAANNDPAYLYPKSIPFVVASNRTYYFPGDSHIPGNVLNIYETSVIAALGTSASAVAGGFLLKKPYKQVSFNVTSREGIYITSAGTNSEIAINFLVRIWNTTQGGHAGTTVYEQTHSARSNPSQTSATTGHTVSIDLPSEWFNSSSDKETLLIDVQRTTRGDTGNPQITRVGKLVMEDLQMSRNYDESSNSHTFGDVTLAMIQLKSNSLLRGVKRRETSFDVTRLINTYDRTRQQMNNNEVEASDVASVTLAMALDPVIGRKQLRDIDAETLFAVRDQIEDYYKVDHDPYSAGKYTQVGYCIDSSRLRFEQLFKMFWNAVNCEAYTMGQIKVYPIIERATSSKQFTHRYKISGTEQRENHYRKTKDGVEVTFRNNKDGKFDTLVEHIDTNATDDPVNPIRIELSSAVNHIQAWTRLKRELNILRHQRTIIRFEADGIARLTLPGERVDVVDNTRLSKREGQTTEHSLHIYDGEVKHMDGLTITVSQPVKLKAGKTHSVRFSDSRGILGESITVNSVADNGYKITLARAPSFSLYTGYKKRKTTFVVAPDEDREGLGMLVRTLKGHSRGAGVKTRKITGINYDSRYFQDDKNWPGES